MNYNTFASPSQNVEFSILKFFLCVILGLFLVAAPAMAEVSASSDPQIAQRLRTLDDSFTEQQSDTKLWQYGWMVVNGGSMVVGSIEAVQEKNNKNRNADIVGAVEGLIGTADLIFRPLPVLTVSDVCRKTQSGGENLQLCLAEKEALAEREKERWNERYELLPHAEILAVNMLAGGAVWRFSSFGQAIFTAISGELIGEAQLWTIPSKGAKDYDAYKVRFEPMVQPAEHLKDTVVGITMTGNF